MFLGSLQVSGLPTSYLVFKVTLPKLLFRSAILHAKHAKPYSTNLKNIQNATANELLK